METLYLDGLPSGIRTGAVFKLLIEQGRIDRAQIGNITINDGAATVSVADGTVTRLVKSLADANLDGRQIRAWHDLQAVRPEHFDNLLAWLAFEADAERSEKRQTQNVSRSLTRLVIRSEEYGVGGRILLQLAPKNQSLQLPWTRLSVGAPIRLVEEDQVDAKNWRGVISALNRKRVEIALTQFPETDADTFRLQFASDAISRQRMERALHMASSARTTRLAELRNILLGEREALFRPVTLSAIQQQHLAGLNAAQKDAVQHALNADDVALIHGPPGTGKTTTVTAAIMALIADKQSVMACAPSNLAVDNLAEKLIERGAKVVRLGHPVRVTDAVQSNTLDALVADHSDYRQAKKIRKDAAGVRREAFKQRRTRPAKGEKADLHREADDLIDEARRMEAQAVERVLDQAEVILSTLTGIDSALLGDRQFDVCVIDEAGQSIEPASWIPITRSQRVILAGDHQQLPPTVLSQKASDAGLSLSLLERLMQQNGEQLSRQLTVQYRMHAQIMDFSSQQFYENTLDADARVASHLLTDLQSVDPTELTETAVTYIDTAGAGYDEQQPDDEVSRNNPEEAALTVKKVQQLLDAGVATSSIAVVTPYSAQVSMLADLLPDGIEVGSIDAMQGREKDAVVISLVRSNTDGEVGFLSETRRMNVALTRARRKLIVIGDSATVTAHPFYASLVEYFESIGAYKSVWEEMEW